MKLVLASGSPRRRYLLETIGLDFEARSPEVDETRFPDEGVAAYVERIARSKAEKLAGDGVVVVAADTNVAHEGRLMGKPGHPEEARAMLRRLQGGVHEVFTGLAVAVWDSGITTRSLVDVAEVEFLPMTEEEVAEYVATGEPMDKAGAYALQGRGALYVKRVSGSPFTVIGLPVHLLPRLMMTSGVDLSSFMVSEPG